MPKYSVNISCHAVMVQHVNVEADSQDEAEKMALDTRNDRIWHYAGEVEGSAGVDSATPVE